MPTPPSGAWGMLLLIEGNKHTTGAAAMMTNAMMTNAVPTHADTFSRPGFSIMGFIKPMVEHAAVWIHTCADYWAAAATYEQLSRLSDADLDRRGLSARPWRRTSANRSKPRGTGETSACDGRQCPVIDRFSRSPGDAAQKPLRCWLTCKLPAGHCLARPCGRPCRPCRAGTAKFKTIRGFCGHYSPLSWRNQHAHAVPVSL